MKCRSHRGGYRGGYRAVSLVVFLFVILGLFGCGGRGGAGAGADAPGIPDKSDLGPSYRPKDLRSKAFQSAGHTIEPMDIETQELTLIFDALKKTVAGKSKIVFHQDTKSRPAFLLDGSVQRVVLNGAGSAFRRVNDPDGENALVVLDSDVPAVQTQVAEIDFTLPGDRVSFTSGGIGFLTDMADLLSRFFDKWGPANFEDDQFALTLRLIVKNSNANHQIFANGTVSHPTPSEWIVRYPANYNSSSFFAHLTNKSLIVNRFEYKGLERSIPITVYSSDSAAVASASSQLPRLFQELEGDYGPYAHPGFIAYLNNYNGGIEFAGATITQLGSLSHELFHSWFARGVMPAEGRAGWIDEAIASWRDNGYARAVSLLSRAPTSLANLSIYERATPVNSYADGRALLGELDRLFAARGGMKTLLRGLFAKYKGSLITTGELRAYLEDATKADLASYFDRYVYGGKAVPFEERESPRASAVTEEESGLEDSFHPPPLTEQELRDLR